MHIEGNKANSYDEHILCFAPKIQRAGRHPKVFSNLLPYHKTKMLDPCILVGRQNLA
jgi:hypothetical protein